MSEPVETITVTREELLAKRRRILNRYEVPLEDLTPKDGDCHCCIPDGVDMPYMAFQELQEIAFLLGEDR